VDNSSNWGNIRSSLAGRELDGLASFSRAGKLTEAESDEKTDGKANTHGGTEELLTEKPTTSVRRYHLPSCPLVVVVIAS
jgi:hypothetical protein